MSGNASPGSRRVWPFVVAALIVGGLLGGSLAAVSHARVGFSTALPKAPSPSKFGTPAEIGTRGDSGNPGALYAGEYASDKDTQERSVGGFPARFSGYTTWVHSVKRVPARSLVDGYPGDYLRVHVTIFNRDVQTQHVCACDFLAWSATAGEREADAVPAPSVAPYTEMPSGATLTGDVYLYVGKVKGPLFVVYRPDQHVIGATSQSSGVWAVPASAG
jgi:hypothetical protein